ncbi:hypothetical protein DXG01_007496 [Tephrocybe rancida]|nr:hypothetical protein DXG01_007496 [Tephrocybe rancida]
MPPADNDPIAPTPDGKKPYLGECFLDQVKGPKSTKSAPAIQSMEIQTGSKFIGSSSAPSTPAAQSVENLAAPSASIAQLAGSGLGKPPQSLLIIARRQAPGLVAAPVVPGASASAQHVTAADITSAMGVDQGSPATLAAAGPTSAMSIDQHGSVTPAGTYAPLKSKSKRKAPAPAPAPASVVPVPRPGPAIKHARSVPDLRGPSVGEGGGGGEEGDILDAQTRRLVALARYLGEVEPGERGMLGDVENKMVVGARARRGSGVGGRKEGGEQEGGTETAGEEEDGEDWIDPRGRKEGAGGEEEPIVHVFVDHSNILFGLLTYLKKHPAAAVGTLNTLTLNTGADSSKAKTKTKFRGLAVNRGSGDNEEDRVEESVPRILTRSRPAGVVTTTTPAYSHSHSHSHSASQSTSTPTSISTSYTSTATATSTPTNTTINTHPRSTPIPLPSLPTALSDARSTPMFTPLSGDGDIDDQHQKEREEVVTENKENENEKEGKPKGKGRAKHLSHTALALILERGRPVSRRVVVTSSPLYQPMDTLKRLGYEVRVYIRVPDLGDGMDRAAKKKMGRKRALSGGTTSGGGSPGTSPRTPSTLASSAPASFHPLNAPTTPARVKYREQGVDELLQLKLHQALAATDAVPRGSTIVLATGDGNVGQFSEDGFLGPVRTALRKGWRVELYSWEDGLSRAWRREFGGSEWEGMFRIIGMEQFAASLVKGAG